MGESTSGLKSGVHFSNHITWPSISIDLLNQKFANQSVFALFRHESIVVVGFENYRSNAIECFDSFFFPCFYFHSLSEAPVAAPPASPSEGASAPMGNRRKRLLYDER
ncbi:hypothetical protein HAX54_033585 [Datura stramonium]|uniref:Uncharacterized protein n=1 Tax=Datura stramonium TaxID=4076 RepID=A0ABS8VE31_DATST|nr:hypothetical protein [Datura stramonium]